MYNRAFKQAPRCARDDIPKASRLASLLQTGWSALQRQPHRDRRAEDGVACRVGDDDIQRQCVAFARFDDRNRWCRHRAHGADGFLHVFDGHPFRDPSHRIGQRHLGHNAASEFCHLAQRDGADGAEVIGDLAAVTECHFAAIGFE